MAAQIPSRREATAGRGESAPPARPLRFELFSADKGLSQAIVECLLIDRRGFLWCGTEDGLNRFDGYEFRVFRHHADDPLSLTYSEIKCLAESRDGGLWVGTFEGLNRFDPASETCRRFRHLDDDPDSLAGDIVRALWEDRRGRLWVGTQGAGLDLLEPSGGGFAHHRHDPRDPGSLADDGVRALYEDAEGRLWVGTAAGLDRRRGDGAGFRHYRHHPDDPHSLPPGGVEAMLQDRAGRLWIGTRGGLAHLDPESGRCRRYDAASGHLAADPVTALGEDAEGRLIVGTDGGGLAVLDADRGTAVHCRHDTRDPASLGTDRVFSCCVDGSGQLWIGTYGAGGLAKADPRRGRFQHFRCHPDDPRSLCHGIVWSIWEDRRGILWVGTDGGLDRIDRRRGEVTHLLADPDDPRGLAHPAVRVVCEGPSGTLWVGTNGGLQRFDRDAGTFERWVHDPGDPSSLPHDEIRSLYEDGDGVLWIGTLGGGLGRFDPRSGSFASFRHRPGDPRSLSSDFVRPIVEDRRGNLWIGTQGGGLDRFDRDTGHCVHFRHDPGDPRSLSSDHVFSIWEDGDGLLWLGTYAGGLDRLDPRTGDVRRYGEADGLPNNLIYGLLGDDDGKLWMTSNKGLTRFDPASERFHTYDWRDGLQADEFNGGSCHRSERGELFFGGINGFNAFWPAELEDSDFEPPVVLTDFQLAGRSLAPGERVRGKVPLERSLPYADRIRLGWEDRLFSFQFAALDFTNPPKNHYAFRMLGFDRTWHPAGAGRRFATYTNLPPGRYRFEVRGTNCDGLWSSRTASVRIEIAPPLWGTWWFRTLAAAAAAGIAARSYGRRIRAIRMETELAAAQEAQRSLWPDGDPRLPGFEIAAASRPASEVGGDFFDYAWQDRQCCRLCIAIGDVAGKGMRAAMTAALSSGLIAAKVEDGGSLEAVLTSVNRLAYRRGTARKFTAVCLACLSSANRELRYANAGMTEPLLASGGGVRFLATPDPRLPLGIREHVAYREERVRLRPGDVLVLYTDGVPEAQNAGGEVYGYEGLARRLAQLPADLSARQILERLLADVEAFAGGGPAHDDMTMVVVKADASR